MIYPTLFFQHLKVCRANHPLHGALNKLAGEALDESRMPENFAYLMEVRLDRFAFVHNWLLRVSMNIFGCAPACLAGLVAVAMSWSASVANDVPIGLRTVWNFDEQGIVRFCYDKTPAIIYFKYDVVRKMTSILKRELDGKEHVVGEFPGGPDPRSLSCSQDGQTIVALGGDHRESLFIAKATQTSVYLIPHFWAFSNVGLYSLISPDGRSITLPEMPTLVAGADLLKEMKVFPNDKVHDVFFVQGYAYLDGDDKIYKYGYVNGEWKILQEIGRPQKFGLGEVARCGDHDVATLIGADSARFLVFEDLPPKQDWLERIGVRKLFRKYSDPVLITGSYGACAFPLRSRMELGSANGLASFGANGPQLISVPDQQVRIPGDNVNFSKDGCYVLIGAPATRLLAVQSVQCQ